MTKTTTFRHFLSFVFGPLIVKGRWFFWILGLLLLMMVGNVITAIRMEIPSIENVHRIKGKFVNTTNRYSKGGLFNIHIRDTHGVIHQCSCAPLASPNCFGRQPSDYAEILNQLNAELLYKNGPQTAISRWLEDRDGEVWMYPNRYFIGNTNSCYQIAVNGYTLLSFEKSVQEYSKAKNSINVLLFWLNAFIIIGLFLIFFVVRISTFLEEIRNGQSRR